MKAGEKSHILYYNVPSGFEWLSISTRSCFSNIFFLYDLSLCDTSSFIHFLKLVKHLTFCFRLSLSYFIYTVGVTFSKPASFIKCPKDFNFPDSLQSNTCRFLSHLVVSGMVQNTFFKNLHTQIFKLTAIYTVVGRNGHYFHCIPVVNNNLTCRKGKQVSYFILLHCIDSLIEVIWFKVWKVSIIYLSHIASLKSTILRNKFP